MPPKPARIDSSLLYRKVALGFMLWNGERGAAARTFLITQERAGYAEGVIRFLGGTSVPPPHSLLSDAMQSLQRVQDYFGPEVTITEEVARDWVPLHNLLVTKVRMYNHPNNLGSHALSQGAQVDGGTVSHEAPDFETHGLLPATTQFIAWFRPRLEQVWLEDGKVKTESGHLFNNVGIIMVLRHMLAQVQGEGEMQILTECNPAWENDNYTPVSDN